MEANISIDQYPDMEFMQEFVNKQGFEKWLKDDSAPPFGKFEHFESFVRADEEIEGFVNTQFNVHVRIPHAHLAVFTEGMEARGWEEIPRKKQDCHPLLDIIETHEKKYQAPPKIQLVGKYGQGKSIVNGRALLKAFERTSEISFTITFSENNPRMYNKLLKRKKGK